MLMNVEEIAERIVNGYEPDRIILYGSHGGDKTHPESDIDLLIIKETSERLANRRIQVEKLLTDRLVSVDILVYTPQEVRYLFSIGSPFVEDIMKKGRVIYMRKVTESWLKDAQDELKSASVLLEHGMYRAACYHSQQSVEKGLKALILEKGESLERTHDIPGLLNKADSLGWNLSLPMDDAVFLNSIYKGRYPTEEGLLPYGEPLKEDAEKAVSSAERLMEEITFQVKKFVAQVSRLHP